MTFIIDESLPWRLAQWLNRSGKTAVHLSELGLLGQPDEVVWRKAASLSGTIVTRDGDFIALARRSGGVSVVRLLVGNCSTAALIARVEALWPDVEARLAASETVIEIG